MTQVSDVATLPIAGGQTGIEYNDTTGRFDDFGGGDI